MSRIVHLQAPSRRAFGMMLGAGALWAAALLLGPHASLRAWLYRPHYRR